jgi:salicylate hydroxylase
VEPNLIHIGDAWRSTSPQLGQGANMALLDAYWLASSLRGNPNVKAALRQTVQNRRRHVLLYQAMSWMFTPFYQSDSRVLTFFRDRIAGPIARKAPFPRLLAMIVSGGIGAPLRGRVPNLD